MNYVYRFHIFPSCFQFKIFILSAWSLASSESLPSFLCKIEFQKCFSLCCESIIFFSVAEPKLFIFGSGSSSSLYVTWIHCKCSEPKYSESVTAGADAKVYVRLLFMYTSIVYTHLAQKPDRFICQYRLGF